MGTEDGDRVVRNHPVAVSSNSDFNRASRGRDSARRRGPDIPVGGALNDPRSQE
jgi:hypothetical protein